MRTNSEPQDVTQVDSRSVVSEDDIQTDSRSVASTQATTASLASRIASLTVEGFEDNRRLPAAWECDETILSSLSEASEQEDIFEITEAELIQELDQQELPLQVCSRLFLPKSNVPLKKLTWDQADVLRTRGALLLDGFISQELSTKLHADTQMLCRQGKLQMAARPSTSSGPSPASIDRTARGDAISWLHPGRPPATVGSLNLILSAFRELQEDLQHVLSLVQSLAEYQLACYSAPGAQYVKHRDALPDDGTDVLQRKVTAIVYGNPNWSESDGGMLRLWLPYPAVTTPQPQAVQGAPPLSSLQAQGPLTPCARDSHCGPASHHAASKSLASTSEYESAGDTTSLRSEPLCSDRPSWGIHRGCGSSMTGSCFNDASTVPDSLCETTSTNSEDTDDTALRDLDRHEGLPGRPDKGHTILDVAPLPGRLVLFLSGAVDHAVLPSFGERIALTAWFS